jgi:hypothetical protein
MSFAVSMGLTTSAIITDEKTGQVSSSYFPGSVHMGSGVLVQMTIRNSSEGNVILNCRKDD